ncbi:DUF4189 domain-containing protein [Lysobacter silvisoli]|nr:DUF4189 domain-containing protein [Lysobacter silvisoli]
MNMSMRCAIVLMLTLIAAQAYGEGQCPSGHVQAPGPESGVINCMPIPSSQSTYMQGRGSRWESRWGAIAFDFGASNVGIGVSQAAGSKRQAKSEALGDCRAKGGQNCRINLVYNNQCAVVIAGFGYSRSQGGPTVESAVEDGMKLCERSGAEDCQIYYKACSLPVQVQ